MTQATPLPDFVPHVLRQVYSDTLSHIESVKEQRKQLAIPAIAKAKHLSQSPFSWLKTADGHEVLTNPPLVYCGGYAIGNQSTPCLTANAAPLTPALVA